MDRIYPPDWLCVQCKRPFFKHVQLGVPDEELANPLSASYNWCFSKRDPNYNKKQESNASWSFKPMDNLTYIEWKADVRKIS
jgi:hypothetical protein